ncbi:MAG: long-chain-acyl-CoA synthetase [Polyangiales bacterium]
MFEGIARGYRLIRGFAQGGARSNKTLALLLQQRARSAKREQPFLLYGERRFSYGESNALVNRHAQAYRALGVGKGDVVALLMDNRPEFLWHFLAAGKLGAVVSLINTHNAGAPLLHSLRICEPKLVVVGSEHAAAYAAVSAELPGVKAVLDVDPEQQSGVGTTALLRFEPADAAAGDDDPPEAAQQALGDLAAYIYTSGTTGLPKAARIRHQRMYGVGLGLGGVAYRLREDDVLYNCLPLYHTSGISACAGAVITHGATLALARRFSASRFWDDVRRYEATCFGYIGELCRYLAAAPPQPNDRQHKVRVIVGNGLRPDIWAAFQERFGIARIVEVYGSTEGNAAALNLDNTVGSVGRLGFGSVLAKWDDEKDDFARTPRGFLIKAKPGESGVLLGRIRGVTGFDGYQDERETERKIVRDAFAKGDAWFNTGDLLRSDAKKRLFFVDRMGDTFRWKGENVSTFEVQEQLAALPSAAEVNVYGVQVPHTEGRAGMVALVLQGEFDATAFKQHVDACLPSYARPLFVRLQDKIEITSTFKLKKNDLRNEGFDPQSVSDPLYMRHPQRDAYVPLTTELFAELQAGRLRL